MRNDECKRPEPLTSADRFSTNYRLLTIYFRVNILRRCFLFGGAGEHHRADDGDEQQHARNLEGERAETVETCADSWVR